MYLAALSVYVAREVSSQEACWYLLGYPFYFGSKKVATINLLQQHLKYQKLRKAAELKELSDNSLNVLAEPAKLCEELIDYKALINSGNELQGISFYNFVVWYRKVRLRSIEQKC